MARLEFRLADSEKQRLAQEAAAKGVTLTRLVKERLFGAPGDDRLDEIERRLERLEEMAGL